MRAMINPSWLLLLLLPSVFTHASTDSCQESLLQANTIDSGESTPPFLEWSEFEGFWDEEMEKMGLTLEPGSYETIRSDVFEANREPSVGGINLCGLYPDPHSDDCTLQIQAMIEVLCVKTRQEMTKLLNAQERTADDNNGAADPYVGEEEEQQPDEPQRVSAAVTDGDDSSGPSGPMGGPVGNPNLEGQGKPQQQPASEEEEEESPSQEDPGRATDLDTGDEASDGGPMGGPVGDPNVAGQGKPKPPETEDSPSEDPGRDTELDTGGPSGGGPMGGPVGDPNVEGQGKPQQPPEDTGRETDIDTGGPPGGGGIAGGPVGNPDQGQGLGKPPEDNGRETGLGDSDEGTPPGPAGGPIGDPNLGQAKPPQDNGKGDLEFEGGNAPCAAQEEALNACYQSNDCMECEGMLEDQNEPEGPPDLFGGDNTDALPSYNAIVAAMGEYLNGQCQQMGASLCSLKECCSPCEAELVAVSKCGLEQGKADTEKALLEVQGALSQFGGADEEEEEPMELEFSCDLEAVPCPAAGGDDEDGMDGESEEDTDGDDMCVEQETALNICVESNECQACEDAIGDDPVEEPDMDSLMGDPTSIVYNDIVGSFNDYFASQCEWVKDSLCTAQECCPPCEEELAAMFDCQNKGMASQLDPVKDMLEQFAQLPEGEEPLEFELTCDLESAACEGGSTAEEADAGERVTVDTAFIVSNKEGWTAQDIKESTDDLTSYLDEMIMNTKFMAKLQNALDRANGNGKLDGKPEDSRPPERRLSMGGTGKFGFLLDNAKVIDVTDVSCPNSTDVSECQRIDASFEVEVGDDSVKPEKLARVLGTATMQWIDSGKLQELLPDDAPYTIEQAIDLREEDSEDSGLLDEKPMEEPMESGDEEEGSPDETTDEEPMDYPIESGVMDQDSLDDTSDEANFVGSPTPDGQPVLVNSTFLLESSEDIQTAKEMKANMNTQDMQRLVDAFQDMASSVVKDLGGKAERHLRASSGENKLQQRQLDATYHTGSAEFYDFKDTPCSQETAVSKQATTENDHGCITVFGKYRVYALTHDDVEEVYQTHAEATQRSIADGKLAGSYVAITEDLDMPEVIFVIQGLSPDVDADFDPYAEMDVPPPTANLNASTMVPVLPNATEPAPESAAMRRVSPSLVALLVGAVSLLNYW